MLNLPDNLAPDEIAVAVRRYGRDQSYRDDLWPFVRPANRRYRRRLSGSELPRIRDAALATGTAVHFKTRQGGGAALQP